MYQKIEDSARLRVVFARSDLYSDLIAIAIVIAIVIANSTYLLNSSAKR